MTVDLLSQRLKQAKRELTALKTAHRRGLGLVKVYKYVHYFENDNIDPPGTFTGTLTINFAQSASPFPFFYVLSDTEKSYYYENYYSIRITGARYANSGMSAQISGNIFYGAGDMFDKVTVYSLAPISSSHGVWEEY